MALSWPPAAEAGKVESLLPFIGFLQAQLRLHGRNADLLSQLGQASRTFSRKLDWTATKLPGIDKARHKPGTQARHMFPG
jgi:hypothetical protein